MEVAISYPVGFALEGWNRLAFDNSLKSFFANAWFDIYRLQQLKGAVSGEDHVSDLDPVFRLLHCASFADMDRILLEAVLDRVGQCLGVKIEQQRPTPAPAPEDWEGTHNVPPRAAKRAPLRLVKILACVAIALVTAALALITEGRA